MKQNIPTSQDGLLGAITVAIAAATKHSSTVSLVRNTISQMTTCRTEAVDTRSARNKAWAELHLLRQVLETERIEAREYAMLTRDQLKPLLGRLHHPGWETVGFRNGFFVPQDAGDLEVMLERIARYLTDNPDKQISAREVTIAKATERYTALKNARTAVKAKEGAVTNLTRSCQAKFAKLLTTLRALVKELSLILSPLDGRWMAFGFNRPGTKERPETPQNVQAVLVGPNTVAVKWDRAPRAVSYKVWKRVDGLDTDFVMVSSKQDRDVIVEDLPPGNLIEVAVSAVNAAGDSARSHIKWLRMESNREGQAARLRTRDHEHSALADFQNKAESRDDS
ncbi:MAG: fibronectin type III domain-containing protein [Limisphaerales bacterium]